MKADKSCGVSVQLLSDIYTVHVAPVGRSGVGNVIQTPNLGRELL